MVKILLDPHVESHVSLQMASVSKHCPSLLADNFLEKRTISEVISGDGVTLSTALSYLLRDAEVDLKFLT